MRTNKHNALLKTKRNLLRGDAGTDISVRGDTVEEVASFFMEMFSGNNKLCKRESSLG